MDLSISSEVGWQIDSDVAYFVRIGISWKSTERRQLRQLKAALSVMSCPAALKQWLRHLHPVNWLQLQVERCICPELSSHRPYAVSHPARTTFAMPRKLRKQMARATQTWVLISLSYSYRFPPSRHKLPPLTGFPFDRYVLLLTILTLSTTIQTG